MKKLSKLLISLSIAAASVSVSAEDVRILAFGDSNTWGWIPAKEGFPAERLSDEKRWAGVLENTLEKATGETVTVVVDGLVGRTTDIPNDQDNGLVAGAKFAGSDSLPQAVARHQPLDLVVIMLGTNDLQASYQRPPAQVAEAAFDLGDLVLGSNNTVYSRYGAPKVLIISPPAYGDTSQTGLSGLFAAGEESSKALASAYQKEALKRGIPVFDAGSVTSTDGIDGVHLTAKNHQQLGTGLAEQILVLLKQ